MNKDHIITRRTFLAAAASTIVSIGLPGTFMTLSTAAKQAMAAELRPDGKPRIPPNQTAVQKIQDMGGTPGSATADDWKLTIHGEVAKPLTLSYKDLLQLEQTSITCDIHCVTGWTLLDSVWSGVRVATLVDLAKPAKNAGFIVFECAKGYTTNIPIHDMQNPNVILAHSLYGKSLPHEHGAPVRSLVPDRYLYKSAKWIEGIKVVSRDEPGFWETRGYSNSADPWLEERYS